MKKDKVKSFKNINLTYASGGGGQSNGLSSDINCMLKNLYNNKTNLEILILNNISEEESIFLKNRINTILNGKNKDLKNFSVDIFSSNKISIMDFNDLEFDIFSSDTNFLMIFLRRYESNFVIGNIIKGKDSYPGIIKTSYFDNLLIKGD